MSEGQERFLKEYPVTRETINALIVYENLLRDWNEKVNLVAASTMPQLWTRHFLDSAQLIKLIPAGARTIADMGAGAGFPGLVLSILAKGFGHRFRVVSIESIGKKADFLQAVVDELKLDVIIRRERIESIRDLKADVVTARALKALPDLLNYANQLMQKDSTALFLKGKSLREELTQAKKYWTFDSSVHPSQSDDSGQILVLKNLRNTGGRSFRSR